MPPSHLLLKKGSLIILARHSCLLAGHNLPLAAGIEKGASDE